jgi:hypothetical protein
MYPEKYRWPIAYFLNLIHWKWCCWQGDDEGFVRLNHRLLIRIIPRELWHDIASGYLNGFYSLPGCRRRERCYPKVIETSPPHAGVKSTGYRLLEPYRRTHRVVCTDTKLNRKIQRIYGSDDRALLPVHRWLKGTLELVQFDMGKAAPLIATMRPRRRGGKGKQPLPVPEFRERVTGLCQKLADGERWLSCDKYGRVHSPITSLARELRCCLSINGSPLVGWDLVNSQPLFLGLFARRYFAASKQAQYRLRHMKFDGKGHPYSYKSLGQAGEAANVPEGVRKYLEVCQEGQFYEALMTPEQIARGEKYRRRLKQRFYRVLFGENNPKGPFPNLLREQFKRSFPTVARLLRKLKRPNYRHSSHLLQNLEATLFIYTICGRIMAERKALPVVTIHDCLYTAPEHAGYVQGVIKDEFRKLRLRIQLKREDYRERP